MMRVLFGAAFLISSVFFGIPAASACSASSINIAAEALNRLGRASTVEDAQLEAGRARRNVQFAETDLMSCCLLVSTSLSDVARSLRNIEFETTASQIQYERDRAFRRFNEAVQNWNMRLC